MMFRNSHEGKESTVVEEQQCGCSGLNKELPEAGRERDAPFFDLRIYVSCKPVEAGAW